MANKTSSLLPSSELRLQQLGDRLRLARQRRRLTSKQVAERAGMTVVTLRSLERGSPGVTMGAYVSVMQVLGIEQDLDAVAAADAVGRAVQDATLSGRRSKSPRAPGQRHPPHVVPPAPAPASVHEARATYSSAYPSAEDDRFISSDDLTSLIVPPNGREGD
jgi:transcriptional regulator with XRE-family HTH domain